MKLPKMSARIAKLRRDQRGYPVPWFVAWIDGVADFRVIDSRRIPEAIRFSLCWTCGEPLGRYKAFVIGPMCAVNRISSEPPSHRDCAEFAAQACPFLTNPAAPRRETALPGGTVEAAGVALRRNPGVTLVWVTKSHKVLRRDDGILFEVGDPMECIWYAEGRAATRKEILASIDSGLPSLREIAEAEGPEAVAALARQHAAALERGPGARMKKNIAGLEVNVESQETCEDSEFVVCCLVEQDTGHFKDNLRGNCVKCGRAVIFRPHAPRRPPRVCCPCAVTMMGDEEAEPIVNSEAFIELRRVMES